MKSGNPRKSALGTVDGRNNGLQRAGDDGRVDADTPHDP